MKVRVVPEEEDMESRAPSIICRPCTPTKAEIDAHFPLHQDYRSWCRFCVEGKGVSRQHRKGDPKEEAIGVTIMHKNNKQNDNFDTRFHEWNLEPQMWHKAFWSEHVKVARHRLLYKMTKRIPTIIEKTCNDKCLLQSIKNTCKLLQWNNSPIKSGRIQNVCNVSDACSWPTCLAHYLRNSRAQQYGNMGYHCTSLTCRLTIVWFEQRPKLACETSVKRREHLLQINQSSM